MMNLLLGTDDFIIKTEQLNNTLFSKHDVSVSMLRLDTIHPVLSGNKIFKLRYFLDEALNSIHKRIVTFGGAYSNHLAATAFACNVKRLRSIGIVRGERPPVLSSTLLFCTQNRMQLEFTSRVLYRQINHEEFDNALTKKFGAHTFIPEGGFSPMGANGAKLITGYFNSKNYTHICCAVGTATTFAGLITGCDFETEVLGFGILKNLHDIGVRLRKTGVDGRKNYSYNGDYHFGGYAKKSVELISFINSFYRETQIPLDFVYTGKMMFGVYDLINKNYFPQGSKILCIHTGGLQGNESLPPGTLNFF